MPTLSLVMIVKDEAADLPACLASAAPFVDEMVIGDTGSRDATKALAAQAGADVFDVPWEADFAAARNAVVARAHGDWLLHLDADEVLDPANGAALRRLVEQDGAGADACELWLANYCNDFRAWRWTACAPDDPWRREHAGYIPVPLLRLFRNHRGYHYRGRVHENISESVRECGGRIITSDVLVHHYGYALEGGRKNAKQQHYLALARQHALEHPRDVKVLRDWAEQANACGESSEALGAAERALALAPDNLDCNIIRATLLLNAGRLAEARHALDAAAAHPDAPGHVQVALAATDYREGDAPAARARLEAVLACAPGHVLAGLWLARAYDALDMQDAALALLEGLADSAPGVDEAAERLAAARLRRDAEAALGEGHLQEGLAQLREALRRDPEDPLLHNAIGVALHGLRMHAKAAESFQRALRLAPGFDAARENLAALA